jgi:hypothetical protein
MVDKTETETDDDIEISTVVHDIEDDDPDDAVVINTPPIEAHEWTVTDTDTVANTNPEYPDESTVIVVAFLSTLTQASAYSDWGGTTPIELPADCQTYAFPRGRLCRVGTYSQQLDQHRHQENQSNFETDVSDQAAAADTE